MRELNCLGDMCPVPILKLRQCGGLIRPGGPLRLLTDHSCVLEPVAGYCKSNGLLMKVVEPMNGIWEITIERQDPAKE